MATTKGDEETAEGISKLSGLMRYLIYETKTEYISLEKEIEHIRNFIELQKLRFSERDEQDISFSVSGETANKFIPPMLFIPFIENAFKFGLSVSQKSMIKIDIQIKEKELDFIVKNTINKKRIIDSESSGIGISNVKKRLELLYPNAYWLQITKDEQFFIVHLKFPL